MEQMKFPFMKEGAVRDLLNIYDLHGENFEETPRRYIQTLDGLTQRDKPRFTTFPLRVKASMIIVKDYVTWSLCPHHLLPVRYTCKIGYIPKERVLGLSKLPRIADWVMSLLPLQEEVPAMICEELDLILKPRGCGCIVSGEHFCMRMRGVQSEEAISTSSAMMGDFLNDGPSREEFLLL